MILVLVLVLVVAAVVFDSGWENRSRMRSANCWQMISSLEQRIYSTWIGVSPADDNVDDGTALQAILPLVQFLLARLRV